MGLKELVYNIGKERKVKMLCGDDGALYSFDPPETLFGFTYHAHMIPPYKPEKMLILGYGDGAIAELTRKIWGNDIEITGVDICKYDYKFTEYKIIVKDALQYVVECTESMFRKQYDYIVVDLYCSKKMPKFIFNVEFIVRLAKMSKEMISINCITDYSERLNIYSDYGFKFEKGDIIERQFVGFWSVIKNADK